MTKTAEKTREKSLDDRIAAALRAPGTTAAEAAALRAEVEAEAEAARRAAVAYRDCALDPRRTGAQVAALRKEAGDAEFEAERITRAAETLVETEATLKQAEAEAARRAAYDAARARRDALAERIEAEWPELAARLVELRDAIEASDAERLEVNRDRPAEAPPLEGAESLARGFRETAMAPLPRSYSGLVPDPNAPLYPTYQPPRIAQVMIPAIDGRAEALRPVGWMNRSHDGKGPRLPIPEPSKGF